MPFAAAETAFFHGLIGVILLSGQMGPFLPLFLLAFAAFFLRLFGAVSQRAAERKMTLLAANLTSVVAVLWSVQLLAFECLMQSAA